MPKQTAHGLLTKSLVYFFYCRGSRASEVFFEFIRGFTGAFQSDGYRTYKSAGKWFLRLACFQHMKRKFLDCGEDFDSKVTVWLINVINKAAALPPNTPLEKYRMLLPDKWKENR